MERIGLRDVLAKDGVGEILLARNRNHKLAATDTGADGVDESGARYEYKVSVTDQFNFHFGTREEHDSPETKVRRHFEQLAGAICAKRSGATFERIVFIPSETLVPFLIDHFNGTTGKQLNKNFRFAGLLALKDSKEL